MKIFFLSAMLLLIIGCMQDRNKLDSSENTDSTSFNRDLKLEASSTGESVSKWAPNAANVLRGEIISVDKDAQKIVFKETVTGNQVTTRVSDPSTLGSFSPGDHIRVSFASSDTTTATNVVAEPK